MHKVMRCEQDCGGHSFEDDFEPDGGYDDELPLRGQRINDAPRVETKDVDYARFDEPAQIEQHRSRLLKASESGGGNFVYGTWVLVAASGGFQFVAAKDGESFLRYVLGIPFDPLLTPGSYSRLA